MADSITASQAGFRSWTALSDTVFRSDSNALAIPGTERPPRQRDCDRGHTSFVIQITESLARPRYAHRRSLLHEGFQP